MCNRHEARFGAEQLLILVQQHLAGIVNGSNPQPSALFRAKHLPRNYVGVVLEPGNDDLVVLLNVSAAPALSDEINGFRSSANKHDLTVGACIEKPARLLAGRLVSIRGARG
jgi:hypothetical protein